jgi:predicted enzyme related to lactoylglutathione lyase
MIKGVESILIGSQNAAKLAEFYKEVVGIKQTMSFEMGEKGESGFMFEMNGSATIVIMDHSKVKGNNKQPERTIINLEIDDMDKEVARMKKAKVKVVQDTYHVEDYGLITTFEDPDDNYFQFVQVRQLN